MTDTIADTSKETVFAAPPESLWPFAACGMLMLAMSFMVAWPLWLEFSVIERAFGWFGVFFFGWGTVLAVIRSLGFQRSVITLGPDGFLATHVSSGVIPWHTVKRVHTRTFYGTTLIVVKVTEEAWRDPRLTRTVRWSRFANRWLGLDGIVISVLGMPVRPADLVKAFRRYAREDRVRRRGGIPPTMA